MTHLRVEKIGPATSIQDIGRLGAQRYGLTTSGALDHLALAIANTLTDQPAGSAAIEVGPLPASFKSCEGDIRLAIAGALRGISVNGQPIALNQSFVLHNGDTLEFQAAREGSFSYLSLEGGIKGEPVFGSLSVNARAGLGSPFNRPLQSGDEIKANQARSDCFEQQLIMDQPAKAPIRVVLGPQDDYFNAAEIERFLSQDWTVSTTSDRMGYRLNGEPLVHSKGFNIVSDGTVNGHIQIPGDGLPLVLLADRGTTGGYPKIACIISADLGRFAQTPANSTMRFKAISIEEAQIEAVQHAKIIAGLPSRLKTVIAGRLTSEALLSVNLSGGMVHALDSRSWAGFHET